MSDTGTARVYSIPAGWSFVDSLAAGVRARAEDDPAGLADVTVLLPTRRACRALQDAFLRTAGGAPLLLPRLLPLGDMDEDELLVGAWEDPGLAGDGGLSIPPAVPGLRRLLLLSRLILARPDAETTPDQAVRLARELAGLLDQVHTERRDFADLAGLVPDEFADHWQVTLEFLKVITEVWPELLAAEGSLDPADRRNRLLEARARLWQTLPPPGPVIAAGSTGSIPATAELLSVVARLPDGAVVLPGLDPAAPDEDWTRLEPHHPQYGMARLLAEMGIARGDVAEWPHPAPSRTDAARSRLINSALAPAGSQRPPGEREADLEAALAGVARLDCPGPREEAAAIALMMRQTLETPGRTAALITPDRGLARRVAAELKRWDTELDDSAGRALPQTPPGAFLRLVAAVAAEDLAPVPLLALLKHPLAAAGQAPAALRRLARRLETAALRGPRPAGGVDGLKAALADGNPDLVQLIDALARALAPLSDAMAAGTLPLAEIVRAHVRAAEALAACDDTSGADRLWAGDAGEAAAGFVAELMEFGDIEGIGASRYPALLAELMSGRVVRPRFGLHPRLFIWGLLEARLQRADLTILGGLNEGTWPAEAQANPWMSRPMLTAFGLPTPERRIGLSAHDFVQAFAAPEVVMTRAERVDGTPTVPCRWLRRLDNLIEKLGGRSVNAEPTWLQWCEALDRPVRHLTATPPRPTPPAAARPAQLSVTQVETLIRDPYAVYAREILRLRPLEPLDADPGAADRGSIVHEALDLFIRDHGETLPDDAEQRLLDIGRRVFDSHLTRPGVRAFWWPRFERIARWFIDNERARRDAGYRTIVTEAGGRLELQGPSSRFTLIARADRIDRRADVGLAVIDYKTGQPPSDKQVAAGLAPQLPLEAAMAEAGAFDGVDPEPVANLTYMQLSGGRQPGRDRAVKLDPAEAIADAVAGLLRLTHKFEDPATPYLSQPRPMFLGRFGDYDHLARVKEWRGRR
ncbi:MAG: double-strand break repair protein AddB [Magnetovibrio sp.]|nr:double-strand break repair protein AddB [Magnetovibrio sp.]